MAANPIAHKLVVFVLALALMVGITPVAVAGTAMNGCSITMSAKDMSASMTQDRQRGPAQNDQAPFKDMGGCCAATCAGVVGISQLACSPVLASNPAAPGWAVQAELAGIRSRPEIPPPIGIF